MLSAIGYTLLGAVSFIFAIFVGLFLVGVIAHLVEKLKGYRFGVAAARIGVLILTIFVWIFGILFFGAGFYAMGKDIYNWIN